MSVSCGKGYNLLFFFYIPRVILCDSISEDRNREQDDNLDRYIFRRFILMLMYVSMNECCNRPLENNICLVSIRFIVHIDPKHAPPSTSEYIYELLSLSQLRRKNFKENLKICIENTIRTKRRFRNP